VNGLVSSEMKISDSVSLSFYQYFSFRSHLRNMGHKATFQLYLGKNSGTLSCIISRTNWHLSRTTLRNVSLLDSFLHMKESRVLMGFEPAAVMSNWFEVNEIKYSNTDALVINIKDLKYSKPQMSC
jgi:hypothetical protein